MISRLRKFLFGTMLMLAMVMMVSGAAFALDTTKPVVLRKEDTKTYLYYAGTNKKVVGATGIHELPAGSKNFYFFKDNQGRVHSSAYVRTTKGIYYAKPNGTLQAGWKVSGKNKRYFHPKTHIMYRGFKKIGVGKNYYYFDVNGVMQTGFVKLGNYTYYFDPTTGIIQYGWKKIDGGQYYFDANGRMATGIYTIGTNTYYFKANGKRLNRLILYKGNYYYFYPTMKTGWIDWDGNRYYFRPSGTNKGKAVIGWFTLAGKQYYFNTNARMQKGWMTVGDKKYYFNPTTGVRAFGKVTIDGKVYDFGTAGYIKVSPTGAWSIKVNQGTQVVTVYRGETPVKAMLCSTGINGATPNGVRYITDKLQWHELDGPSWGQYCEHLSLAGQTWSSYLFHSVWYSRYRDNNSLATAEFNKLGSPASHGCVRLSCGDAYYIYSNCPIGTKVTIFRGTKADDPLPRPANRYISTSYDPTDPITND